MNSLAVAALLSACLHADPVSKSAGKPSASVPVADAQALAGRVDRLIRDALAAAKVASAPQSDDATFFRRIHLVLAGRPATPEALSKFLADPDPRKRAKAIEGLLASKDSTEHFVGIWRGWLIPEADTNADIAGNVPAFEFWLREKLSKRTPYDQFVKELLTVSMNSRLAMNRPADGEGAAPAANPLAWYLAKEAKPENLAAAASRTFLGLQLECAQCHDHPTAKWSRDQFWGTAAFFGGIERAGGNGLREVLERREMAIPSAFRTVQATFLDDREPVWRYKQSARVAFADWVIAKDNPFFAKAAVNRIWGYLFGVGLVDPIDAFDDKNPPSHPELLDELARSFVAANYDLRYLIEAIVLTEAFQRSSALSYPGQEDARKYARFTMQGQSPEQLAAGLTLLLGPKPEKKVDPRQPVQPETAGPSKEFRETFALGGKRTESQTTILQALALMNGTQTAEALDLLSSKLYRDSLDAKVPLSERIDRIYLAVLNRKIKPDELTKVTAYVAAGKEKERIADLLWVLLNSLEFRTIH